MKVFVDFPKIGTFVPNDSLSTMVCPGLSQSPVKLCFCLVQACGHLVVCQGGGHGGVVVAREGWWWPGRGGGGQGGYIQLMMLYMTVSCNTEQ